MKSYDVMGCGLSISEQASMHLLVRSLCPLLLFGFT